MKPQRLFLLAGVLLVLAGSLVLAGAGDGKGEMRPGRIIKKVEPVYPPEAKAEKIQGVVVLKIKVDAAGKVAEVTVVSGHEKLTQASVDAVKQWEYEPCTVNGKKVGAEATVTIRFMLSDDEKEGKPEPKKK